MLHASLQFHLTFLTFHYLHACFTLFTRSLIALVHSAFIWLKDFAIKSLCREYELPRSHRASWRGKLKKSIALIKQNMYGKVLCDVPGGAAKRVGERRMAVCTAVCTAGCAAMAMRM